MGHGSLLELSAFMEKQQLLLIEREAQADAKVERVRQEARDARAELEAQVAKLRQEIAPHEAIAPAQIQALESRLEALHAAGLLSDEELCALEDVLADLIEARARCAGQVVTMHDVLTSAPLGKAHALISLSEGLAKDGAFARQARRKVLG